MQENIRFYNQKEKNSSEIIYSKEMEGKKWFIIRFLLTNRQMSILLKTLENKNDYTFCYSTYLHSYFLLTFVLNAFKLNKHKVQFIYNAFPQLFYECVFAFLSYHKYSRPSISVWEIFDFSSQQMIKVFDGMVCRQWIKKKQINRHYKKLTGCSKHR